MRDSRLRWSILNTLMILGFTVLIVVVFYFLDLWFLGVFQENLGVPLFGSLTDLFFIQGVGLILIGFMALLGRIKYLRQRGRPVNLREIFWSTQVERWVPKGYLRLGLTLTYSGATMILIYFLNL